MKIIVLIISKDQASYIPKMIEATKGFDRFWVIDRCSDNSAELLQSYGETFIENKEGEGFLAGKMRDIGLSYILSKEYDVVVMFDGDRIPINLSKKLVLEEMNRVDCSLALAEKDSRRFEKLDDPHKKVVTAGLIIKTKYLHKIRRMEINNGRCFNPRFDGAYGCEDLFLGSCLYISGAIINFGPLIVSGRLPSDYSIKRTKEQNDIWLELDKELYAIQFLF